jgi:hypothetical protein
MNVSGHDLHRGAEEHQPLDDKYPHHKDSEGDPAQDRTTQLHEVAYGLDTVS